MSELLACILRKISLNVINLKQQKRRREIYFFPFMLVRNVVLQKILLMHLSDVITKMHLLLKGNKKAIKSPSCIY